MNIKSTDLNNELIGVFEHVQDLVEHNKLKDSAKILLDLHCADLADFLDNTNVKIHQKILPLIAQKMDPETLIWLSRVTLHSCIEVLGFKTTARLIGYLDIEDSIEVIQHLDQDIAENILKYLDKGQKNKIIEGFAYPEDTVGRILERDFITFQDNWKVSQAVNFLQSKDLQDVHAVIIVDKQNRPVGNILLSKLLKAKSEETIFKIMNNDIKIVDTLAPLEEISFIFKQYALTIVPVVNKNGKLVGVISINNMIYIIEKQAEKNIMQLSGVYEQDIFENIFRIVGNRFPWLFINLITACMTSIIINQFSTTISHLITIASIMPIVASMGGNAGTQTMTITIRALAHKNITRNNRFKVITKEILSCALNGLLLAFISASLSLAIFSDIKLSVVLASSIIINFIFAGFLGSVIPITFYNFKIDPATSSGVFLTALTDSLGFFTFLYLSFSFL